ncbi:hypothetical protein P3S67_021487 [Capsicum chacoense]
MPGGPGKNRRKSKDEPKKWGKLSKKKVSRSPVQGAKWYESSNISQPSTQHAASWNPPPPHSSSICGDTSAMARDTYTQSQTTRNTSKKVSSVVGRGQGATSRGQGVVGRGKYDSGRGQCGAERGGGSGRDQGGIGRGLTRKIANARGTLFESGRNASSSQVPLFSTNKRPYNATSFAATTGYKRLATGFGVYSDPATGTQVYNPSTSSERVLYGGINLKSASPTNVDISFKPSGLKWNGKDAVTSTQL